MHTPRNDSKWPTASKPKPKSTGHKSFFRLHKPKSFSWFETNDRSDSTQAVAIAVVMQSRGEKPIMADSTQALAIAVVMQSRREKPIMAGNTKFVAIAAIMLLLRAPQQKHLNHNPRLKRRRNVCHFLALVTTVLESALRVWVTHMNKLVAISNLSDTQ